MNNPIGSTLDNMAFKSSPYFDLYFIKIYCHAWVYYTLFYLLKLTWTVIYYCRWQPYFSIEPLSIMGYWLGECRGWFHMHGLPRAARSGSENYKMKTFCPQRDSNSRPLDCDATTVWQWDVIHFWQIKTYLGFSCAIYFCILTRGRVFVVYSVL